jgi:hypothetical protein
VTPAAAARAFAERPLAVRVALIAVLLAGLAIGARDVSRSWFFPLERQQIDLRVLYCAGRAALAGANPYALEPIRTCEHLYTTRLLERSPHLTLPFTLPGYDLPLVDVLARLPLDTASSLFTIMCVLTLGVSIVLVARATGVGFAFAAAALLLSIGFPTLPVGQLATFELVTLAATGWALAARRERWAGVFAASTLFEPHIGGFVVIAVAVLVPRARVALAVACVGLVVLAFSWSSPAQQLAYVTVFLPGQALGDLHSPQQYGLSYALTLLGVPDGAALLAGSVWTVLMLVVSIPIARACAARGQRAAIAFVPAACAVIGGTYMHVTQEALAVPAALALLRVAPNRTATALAATSVVLLAVPWPFPAGTKQLLVLSLVCVAVTTWYAGAGALRTVILAVAASWAALLVAENHLPPAIRVPVVANYPADTPIGVEYRAAIEQTARLEPYDVAVKVPTWCGLIALLGAGAALFRRERSASAERSAALAGVG